MGGFILARRVSSPIKYRYSLILFLLLWVEIKIDQRSFLLPVLILAEGDEGLSIGLVSKLRNQMGSTLKYCYVQQITVCGTKLAVE